MDFIIPAYNEEDNIANIISEIREYFQGRVIVVDDYSSDETYNKIPEGEGIIKIRNDMNCGKGYSIKKGLCYVSGDFISLIDGDMRGVAGHIRGSLNELYNYDCTVFSPPIKSGGIGLLRRFAQNVVLRETGLCIPWCLSGMRIIKKSVFENIMDKLDDRFAFETSMTIELIKNKYSVNNIIVEFDHRLTGRDVKGFYHRGRQFGDIYKYYHKIGR